MAAHPVYLYTPGGSFLQTPDGRPLLMQVGYVGAADGADVSRAAVARAPGAATAKTTSAATARAAPTFEARVN